MKEITRIIDVQITTIAVCGDADSLMDKKQVEQQIKSMTGADDVHVKRIKDFERDLNEEKER